MIKLNKLNSDLVFSFFSLGILGLCGLILSFIIGFLYNAEVLGIWGQSFSVFLIGSQVAAFGLQFSAQAQVSSSTDDREKSNIVKSVFLVSLPVAFLVSLLLFFMSKSVASLLDSPRLTDSLEFVAVSCFFYAQNKVIIGCLNGLRFIKSMSILQAGRGIFLVSALFVFYSLDISSSHIGLILVFSEVLVFLIGCILLLRSRVLSRGVIVIKNIYGHLEFGSKSIMSGLLLEINTKVDTLVIGYYMGDRSVGYYTLAVSIAEGYLLLLSVFRNNFNPILAEFLSKDQLQKFFIFLKLWKTRVYLLTMASFLVSIPIFYILVSLLDDRSWDNSIIYYCLISIGYVLISGYYPFLAILLQIGKPGWFSLTNGITILLNLFLNIILVPRYGLTGAAAATSLSVIISGIVGVLLTNYLSGIKVFKLTYK